MNSATAHLSEEDFDDLLLGLASTDAAAHAAACPACRERAAAFATQFQSQMTVFNQATRDWSEARSNTISRDLKAHHTPLRLTQAGLRYATAAAALAVAFTLTTGLHRDSNRQTPAQTETAATTPDEIASDNAMLSAINSETETPRPAQFGLYEDTTTHVAAAPRAISRQVKD